MIYYDNAATTPPLRPDNYTPTFFANPSSPHKLGITSERQLHIARTQIATILQCQPKEIIFTSGATESNNLALIGLAMANQRNKLTFFSQPWEHPSIIEPLTYIKSQKIADVHIAPMNNWASIPADKKVVVLSHINSETGAISDIATIASKLKQEDPSTIIIVDGAQSFCKINTPFLPSIDMYSFSAHKCHGPTGVGGLVLRQGIRLSPLLHGGNQENSMRAGTENTGGILQLATTATELFNNMDTHYNHVSQIKATLLTITKELPGISENIPHTADTTSQKISPYILNLSAEGIRGEILVHMLSEHGLYVSMGTACRSRKNKKSALELMGFTPDIATNSIRLSFSHQNTLEEAETAKRIVCKCIQQLRKTLNF